MSKATSFWRNNDVNISASFSTGMPRYTLMISYYIIQSNPVMTRTIFFKTLTRGSPWIWYKPTLVTFSLMFCIAERLWNFAGFHRHFGVTGPWKYHGRKPAKLEKENICLPFLSALCLLMALCRYTIGHQQTQWGAHSGPYIGGLV